jgi:hypothetical protein
MKKEEIAYGDPSAGSQGRRDLNQRCQHMVASIHLFGLEKQLVVTSTLSF